LASRVAPKDIAPSLFKSAKFKKRPISHELHNNNWIRNIGEISSPGSLEEYVMLFLAISAINLLDQPDQIRWRWTTDGKFLVASAYACQFNGAMTSFSASDIWKANTEPKCNFFAWLVLHGRILTIDLMAKKHWPCNLSCSLCFCELKNAPHLLLNCNFSDAVWNITTHRCNLPSYSDLGSNAKSLQWVNFLNSSSSKKERLDKLDILFSFWWELWKEHNRRVFQASE
jgi:hypothetical protein